MAKKEREVRDKAEKIVFAHFSLFKKRKFKKILRKTRFHIKYREELRFMRTKIYGIIRSIMNAIGRNFYQDKIIMNSKDIFYLTVDEVFELIEGRSPNQHILKDLIELRKKDFEAQKLQEGYERMYFYGDIYRNNFVEILSDSEIEIMDENSDPNKMQGVPCSPGIIENVAKIVLTPEDATLNGEILVTKRTDPGWVPLFPSISGLLIERGSVLSHSAVVAREMGIPTVVGLRKVTEKIKTGDRLKLDGGSGMVEKL
jgi:pyruvate,water dikinase